MDMREKLVEAKLMAIEKILFKFRNESFQVVISQEEPYVYAYDYAKEILQAIHNAEIAEELRQHEANLLTRDEKPE